MTMSDLIKRAFDVASSCSNCHSRKVGAVIQLPDNIGFAVGYNNTNSEHCEKECYRKRMGIERGKGLEVCNAIHAEADAIDRCKKHGISLDGAHIHVTHQPCDNCAKLIVASGIKTVTWCEDYPHSQSVTYFKEHGINAFKVNNDMMGEN